MQKDETTFNLDEMDRKDIWSYYTSSFVRIEPTEGVPRVRMQKSLLTRNLPSEVEADENAESRKPLAYSENLVLRVCLNTSKILFKFGSSEWFIYGDNLLTWDDEKNAATSRARLQKYEDSRTEKFREKFVFNNKWMKDLDHEQVQNITLQCKKWFDDGTLPGSTTIVDVVMEGSTG